MASIGFVGGGNMGEAILRALLENKTCLPGDISVSDISRPRREYLEKRYGVSVTAGNQNRCQDEGCTGRAPTKLKFRQCSLLVASTRPWRTIRRPPP